MSVGTAEVDAVVTELQAGLDGREVTLTLSSAGTDAVRALGAAWLLATVRSLETAYPGRGVELVLRTSSSEPMPEGGVIQPASAGGIFLGGDGVGRLTVRGEADATPVWRVLQLPSPDLLAHDGTFTFIAPTDRVRRRVGALYSALYDRAPVLLDTWRQNRNDISPSSRSPMQPRAPRLDPVGAAVAPREPQSEAGGRRPAVWVAMHWIETGGAEAWGFRSAQIARDAGYEVVITADRSAPQRALDKALEITPHVYLAANALAHEDWDPFLRGLLERHDIRLVHVHHSARAYAFLPELKHIRADIGVIDSTHIVEHRTGGFVRQSLEYSNLIDVHHVISPELRDLYLLDGGVRRDKVVYRPLTDLHVSESATRTDGVELIAGGREPGAPLRIGFLGRLVPQKRPFLFVELVRRLHRAHPGAFTFLMQGSGTLEPQVRAQIARSGLSDVIVRREWGPVADFFASVDVLVVSSDNEGITLTSLEADEHGVLVVSADVGSQRTVVAPAALVPRQPQQFLRQAQGVLERLAADDDAFARAQSEQRALLAELRAAEPATTFLTTFYHQLKERT
ncbi:glycosyltransferase [Georgenia sp. MJ206]|uniref:glycosyltransferase n=1 Tax=Georgenia wangjunii TaxID=3117730 RepID=UPI002F265140